MRKESRGANIRKQQKNLLRLEEGRKKFSFFFKNILHDNYRGMSFILYKLIKKIVLPMIHVMFHEDLEFSLTILLITYTASFLYLRLVEPFKNKFINVLTKLTELGHINFLVIFKLFSQALSFKNTELALALGRYLIYVVLGVLIMNSVFYFFILIINSFGIIIKFLNKRKDFVQTFTERRKDVALYEDSKVIDLKQMSKVYLKNNLFHKILKYYFF